ncbi:protein kinase [Streptomyces sp. ISL-36]|uniref:serine/threonine-protein kinase n=1 Tax=Streptomyces sp. ISL-36 TaxID=2819182 RepID=UPI001BEA2479|nr:serine/threonine-protein kinase [Streptomyces sp. ISL-36]MBT2442196.1 protein kinase [Streptomyces sp. ISL-36]
MLSPLTHDDPAAIAAYRLLARLGSGGMGTVYLARTRGGRTVALKTVHARLAADPAFRARFRLEVDAARIIGARHGAAVVDADPLAETPWLATEYVLGPPLDDAVALAGPLPEPTVRALGAALAGALAQLHSSDVVHRDLKPSNVLVTAYGPKIIDFGIARAAGDDRLTSTGAAAGTPAFMSPEQAGGQEHTPAGDIFALAGVLVFAATGHGPFGTGAPADLLYRVRYADPDLTGLPPSLLPLLTACLSKDPSARPTTSQLATQLHDGRGDFADHLPPLLLTDIARRATDVWLHHPHRLPAPADDPYGETVPVGSRRSASRLLSRRSLLALGGGALLAAGGGAWAWRSGRATEKENLPSAPLLGDAPASLWSRDMAVGDEDERGYPLVIEDTVAMVAGTGISAQDQESGDNSWFCTVETSASTVTTDGRQIYVVPQKRQDVYKELAIHTVDLDNGDLEPAFARIKDLNANMYSTQLLCAADGVVYLAGTGGTIASPQKSYLLAVEVATGKEVWRLEVVNPERDTAYVGAAAVRGGRLVTYEFGTEESTSRLVVRDVRTGATRWARTFQYGPGSGVGHRPCMDDDHVYLAGESLVAHRLSDGSRAWSFAAGEREAFGATAVRDGVVYTTGFHGIVAVGAADGKIRWHEQGPGAQADQQTHDGVTPVVGERYVYKKVTSGLSAIDLKTHRSNWVFQTDVGRLVAQERDGRLFAVGEDFLIALPLQ